MLPEALRSIAPRPANSRPVLPPPRRPAVFGSVCRAKLSRLTMTETKALLLLMAELRLTTWDVYKPVIHEINCPSRRAGLQPLNGDWRKIVFALTLPDF